MAERRARRVAFNYVSRKRWAGGYNYKLNLFTALARHCPGTIAPVLFAGMAEPAAELAPFAKIPGVEVVRSDAFETQSSALAAALVTGIDRRAARAFEASGIDVVFENARFFGWRLPIPVLAWFPDFQHLKLPGLFSLPARLRREAGFRAQIASGRSILLSSESALADFRMGIGLASGRAVAGRIGTVDQVKVTVFGPVVNLAARLEGMTKSLRAAQCASTSSDDSTMTCCCSAVNRRARFRRNLSTRTGIPS